MDFKPIFGYLEWKHQTEISILIKKKTIMKVYMDFMFASS